VDLALILFSLSLALSLALALSLRSSTQGPSWKCVDENWGGSPKSKVSRHLASRLDPAPSHRLRHVVLFFNLRRAAQLSTLPKRKHGLVLIIHETPRLGILHLSITLTAFYLA